MIVHLTDLAHSGLDAYARLTDVALRSRHEPAAGLYIAESALVIGRAITAGHRPRSFLMAPKWLESMRPVLTQATGDDDGGEVPVFVAPEELLRELTGFHLHRGALAAVHRPTLPAIADLLAGEQRSRIAVLDGLVDHTNVGACFRSAAAMGVDAVLVTPRCADPLYRRAIRVSMGTVFQVPWTRIDPWPSGLGHLKAAGYCVAGMMLADDAITLDALVVEDHPRLALVFGTEGHGITPKAERELDRRVTIPMMGGVDSLNVAASSAVAFYATRQQAPGNGWAQ